MTGLDPVIAPPGGTAFPKTWIAGSSPAMTVPCFRVSESATCASRFRPGI